MKFLKYIGFARLSTMKTLPRFWLRQGYPCPPNPPAEIGRAHV